MKKHNLSVVNSKAKVSFEKSGNINCDHFVDVNKMVAIASGCKDLNNLLS